MRVILGKQHWCKTAFESFPKTSLKPPLTTADKQQHFADAVLCQSMMWPHANVKVTNNCFVAQQGCDILPSHLVTWHLQEPTTQSQKESGHHCDPCSLALHPRSKNHAWGKACWRRSCFRKPTSWSLACWPVGHELWRKCTLCWQNQGQGPVWASSKEKSKRTCLVCWFLLFSDWHVAPHEEAGHLSKWWKKAMKIDKSVDAIVDKENNHNAFIEAVPCACCSDSEKTGKKISHCHVAQGHGTHKCFGRWCMQTSKANSDCHCTRQWEQSGMQNGKESWCG